MTCWTESDLRCRGLHKDTNTKRWNKCETQGLTMTTADATFGGNAIEMCIFDMDGLLLDTERLYTVATQRLLDRHAPGEMFSWEVKAQIMGTHVSHAAQTIIDHHQLPLSIDQFLAEVSELHTEIFPTAQLLPGVERLVRHLNAKKIPIAVATSSTTKNFAMKTSSPENTALFQLFDVIVRGDDPRLARSKPHPDIFQLAALDLIRKVSGNKDAAAPDPTKCLVFEDSEAGLCAAEAANMHSVWIPDENMLRIAKKRIENSSSNSTPFPKHNIQLSSMLDFKPEQFGLPPFVDGE